MRLKVGFLVLSVVLVATVVALGAGAAAPVGKGLYRLVGLFGEVVGLLRSNYVEEVPYERLEMGALTGMVEAADPGGSFVPDASAPAYEKARTRAVPAFGVVLGKRASYPAVLQVLPGSPAAVAGILAGELIERIGDEPVRARPLWHAQVLLDKAEAAGTAVTLDVIDRALSGKRAVKLAGATGPVPSPKVTVKDGTPVVRVESLQADSVARLGEALAVHTLATAVIVDLRGVSLGTPDGAAQVAAFLSGGAQEIRLEGPSGNGLVVRGSGPARTWKLVVCVDHTTAGAAELAALALKAHGATLVGVETYGDTGQRRAFPGPGGTVWLAQRWGVNADGAPVLGDGIKPDEAVMPSREGDAILDRALELAHATSVQKAA